MKTFKKFADHWFGSWVINGISVIAFIVVLKVIMARLPNSGVAGAAKGTVNLV